MIATTTAIRKNTGDASCGASKTRETFPISRSLEYLSEAELTKQLGYSRDQWLLVLVKELIDNALDNCEEIEVQPDVTVTLGDDSISVQDNGSGIGADTVAQMLDFTNRVSSREVYRSLTRGAQGNAGKCVIAIPFVWDETNPGSVTITACGVRHDIAVSIDQLVQMPRIAYSQTPEKVQIGTLVEVHLPGLPSKLDESERARFVLFAQRYAGLNSHLRLTLTLFGESQTWEPTAEICTKWTAAQADPPAWYDLESFERLAGVMISKDKAHKTDRSLREFLRGGFAGWKGFAGLSRSDALKAVTDETGLTRCSLSELLNHNGLDRTKTERLLRSLQEHGTNPKPEKLGSIGKTHIEKFFDQFAVWETTKKYKRLVGSEGNLPFVVEAAFAEVSFAHAGTTIITGCNFSPAVDSPVVRMLDGLLREQMIDGGSSVVVLLHIVTPAPTFLDRGKSVLDVQGELRVAVQKAVLSVTGDYKTKRKAAERDAAAAEKEEERRRRAREAKPDETSVQDAVLAVISEAIEKASGGNLMEFGGRDFYYAARELIQQYTDKPLTQKYFDAIVDRWEIEYGLIDGLQRDPRGFLLEPHTHKRIPLGTKAVDDYVIPLHQYDTILYFEKKGLEGKLAWGQIGDKYDCAIMCSEGYAVRAAKSLLQSAQGTKKKVLCFHDADPDGKNIKRTLGRSTGAHKFNIDVVDCGLNLEEALEMGLPTETFSRKKALPSKLELSDLERKYFTGEARSVCVRGKYKTHWVNCQRVELNALSADPHKFIAWVEAKLKQHGVAKKLIPPKKVIYATARDKRDELLTCALQDVIERQLDINNRVAEMAAKLGKQIDLKTLPADLKTWAAELRPESWRKYLESLVRKRVDELGDDIEDLVAESFGGAL
jgi:hypothetical protein